MFETIIALTSSNIRRMNSAKFVKTFSSFNWSSVLIEINCRPRKKLDIPFSITYENFEIPPNKMVRCKKTPLESINLSGDINKSKINITCIFDNGNSQWFEAKIEGENKKVIEIIEQQLLKTFKIQLNVNQN